MSGVGLTGEIVPLNGGAFPVFEDINGKGGARTVPDAAARDAIPANSRKVGMQVTLQDTGVTYQLVGGIANANYQAGGGAPQPFKVSFWVNPAFTGVQTGSSSNPYTTIAACFAAAVALGLAAAVINLPPRATITENVVFPSGGFWDIQGVQTTIASAGSVINGTIDITNAGSVAVRTLTNLTVTGAITGSRGASNAYLVLRNALTQGPITLTTSVANGWVLECVGGAMKGVNALGGACTGNVAIQGAVKATQWAFVGSVSFSATTEFDSCDFNAPGIFSTAAVSTTATFTGSCSFAGGQAITASSGALECRFDSESARAIFVVGSARTGSITFSTLNSQCAARTTRAADVGPTAFGGTFAESLMVCEAALTLLVPGTLGNAVLNVIYTDLNGVVQTKPVTTLLNVAGAAGDMASGSFVFSQSGATQVAYSISGITTPGALSYKADVAVRIAS